MQKPPVVLITLACLASAAVAHTESRRALLVGINKYRSSLPQADATPPTGAVVSAKAVRKPPEKGRGSWIDLDGAVNDVDAMRQLLLARYGFKPEDILVLQDGAATRSGIIDGFRKHLLDGAKPGQAALFFYAGHGSQVRNSRTDEADGMDETIVPADSAQGTPDIRDKELARLYNEALDRQIVLTVISDSCHSGSVARGLPRPDKQRSLPPDPRDVAEAASAGPSPEERGALILSAAQDYQTAGETTDDQGSQHGVFSYALLKTLQSVPLDEPAQRVFLRVKAMMQSEGRPQEPVIAASTERRNRPLFGDSPASLSGRVAVPVLRQEQGVVTLQAGSAVGLRERCELRRSGAGTPARLRVSAVKGLGIAEAEVIEGDPASVKSGDVFEIDRFVPDASALRVFTPPGMAANQLEAARVALGSVRTATGIHWVEDPTHETPSHLLAWDGSGWTLTTAGQTSAVPLGAGLDAAALLKRLTAPNPARLYAQIPPPLELGAQLALGSGTPNDAVAIATRPGDAHYLLSGRLRGYQLEYAWVRPNATQDDAAGSVQALPARTDWVALAPAPDATTRLGALLQEQALRLGKVQSWLSLGAPADEGRFPYQLALRNADTGEVKTDGQLRAGETYSLLLQATDKDLASVEKRFVYVFTIDSFGNSTLLFPRTGAGNIENRLPIDQPDKLTPDPQLALGRVRFKVGPPYGTDTYILLTSVQPIGDPDVLQFQGVRTRGISAAQSPLGRLLGSIGGATRGAVPETPADWSLERLLFRSTATN